MTFNRRVHLMARALGALLSAEVLAAKDGEVLYTDNPPLICAKNGELDCIAGNLPKAAAKSGGSR